MPALKTARHERFVQELLKGRTHREAYRLAGFRAARGHAARLAQRPEVAARYQELAQAAAQHSVVTAAKVIDELSVIAFANLADYITLDAEGVPQADLAKLRREQSAALVEVSATAHGVRVKVADKLAALNALGRMLGLFRERVEVMEAAPEPEPLSDFEVAKRIAFILQKAVVEGDRRSERETK